MLDSQGWRERVRDKASGNVAGKTALETRFCRLATIGEANQSIISLLQRR